MRAQTRPYKRHKSLPRGLKRERGEVCVNPMGGGRGKVVVVVVEIEMGWQKKKNRSKPRLVPAPKLG